MTTPTVTTRVPFWDNARFVAVTLVVVGHGIQRLNGDSDPALVLYLFIYAFHMPAFAIISGYFAKPGPPTAQQVKRVITDLIVPYVIMETIWTLVRWLVEGDLSIDYTTASWTLWFLLALAIFRLILPYLALLRWPLLWAVLLSLAVGFSPNVDSTFSLSRAIGILPFFVLGWKLREWGVADRWLAAARAVWPMRLAALGVFGGWLVVVATQLGVLRELRIQNWFFYNDGYAVISDAAWWSPAVRLGFIMLAVLLSCAFLVLIPRRETWISELGKATMYIYLLHSFVLYPIRESGVLGDANSSGWWVASMVVAGVAIALALASPPVRWMFRPLVEPRTTWLFADRR